MTRNKTLFIALASLAATIGPSVHADGAQEAEAAAKEEVARNVVEVQAQVRAKAVAIEAAAAVEQAAIAAEAEAAEAPPELNAEAEPIPLRAADEKKPEDKPADDKAKPDEAKKPSPEEIRKKMQQMESELAKMRDKYQQEANKERQKKQEKARVDVSKIKLAKNPTRQQCETYITELRDAAKNIRSYSSNDPIVKKLKEIPIDHFDLLVDEIASRSKLRYFANYAMRETDKNEIRKRFIKSIERSDSAIGIIVMNGWAGDIEEAVRKKIASADGSLDQAWFQAAVELQDPALYGKLHEITINSRYATQFVTMLETLPDYDLAHTINVCWKRAEQGKLSISESTLAPHAVKYGNVKALEYQVRQLRYTPSYTSTSSSYTRRRMNVLKYIDYRGSNDEIVKWYDKNKKKLIFDHYRKRFVTRGTSVFDPPGGEPDGDAGNDAPAPANNADANAQGAAQDAAEALELQADSIIVDKLEILDASILVE